MGKFFVTLGNWFRSLQGWLYMLSAAVPAVFGWIAATWDGLSWSARLMLVLGAIAVGLNIVCAAIWVFDKIRLAFKTAVEQDRIMAALGNLGEEVAELDLLTAAAIWAGTGEIENIDRHVHFRGLKNAVDNNRIKAENFDGRGKAYKKTKLDFESLKDYWRGKGVIR